MDAKSLIGSTIADNFQLLSIAGVGGMGTVFKAKQIGLDRTVAVKILDPKQVCSEDSILRFEREAKSISQLSHLHIASFYSYGVLDNALPYIVMEWLEGKSLFQLIHSQEKVSAERAIRICIQIADALGYAHEHGIVHRDLKPANVLLLSEPEADFVKVVDFGLARMETSLDGEPQKLTKTGALLGTPQYLSPEQCMGAKADARSDVYALGCILYETLSGAPPFDAENAMGLIHQHVNAELPPLSNKAKVPLPDGLEQVVSKCLEKSADNRYATMSALVSDLKKVLAHQADKLDIKLSTPQKKKGSPVVLLVTLLAIVGISALLLPNLLFNDVAKCRSSLAIDKSEDNIIYWQERAEINVRNGKNEVASLIETEVDRRLDLFVMKPAEAANLCLKLSKMFASKGYQYSAGRFAVQAVRRSAHAPRAQVVDIVDEACTVLIKTKHPIKTDDIRLLSELGIMHHSLFEDSGKAAIFALLQANSTKLKVTVRFNQIFLIMRSKEYALARARDLKALQTSLPYSINAMRMDNSTPWLAAWHVAKLARILANEGKAPELARQYVQQSLDMVRDLENKKTPHNNDYATIMENLSAAEVYLGAADKAVHYAQNAVDTVNSPHFNTQLANALNAAHQYADAEKIARVAYLHLVKNEGEGARNDVALALTQSLLGLRKVDAALDLIAAELENSKKRNGEDTDTVWHLVAITSFLPMKSEQKTRLAFLGRKVIDLSSLKFKSLQCDMLSGLIAFEFGGKDLASLRRELPIWLECLRHAPADNLCTRWSMQISTISVFHKAGDTQSAALAYEALRQGYIELCGRKELDAEVLDQVVYGLKNIGYEKESEELYWKAATTLSEPARTSFISRYAALLLEQARKANYLDSERILKAMLAKESLTAANWQLRRHLLCMLNEALMCQQKYREALKNMLEAEAYEKKYTRSEPDLFELQASIAFYCYKLGDLPEARKKVLEMLSYKSVKRGWELSRIWYVYASLLDAFKGAEYEDAYRAVLELFRTGYLQCLHDKSCDPKLLAAMRAFVWDHKEEQLIKETDAEAKRLLSPSDFEKLITRPQR